MSERQRYLAALAKQRDARELSPTPVPRRITTALDLQGLYGPEVDRALGGEEPMVDQWEAGELVPTAEQIKLLSDLTGYPVKFFYMPVKQKGGPGFICSSNGCEQVWFGPPAEPEPVAEVIVWPGRTVEPELTEPFQDALW